MELSKLFERKGRLTTELELKQSELQQVNSAIVKLLQDKNKQKTEPEPLKEEPKEE